MPIPPATPAERFATLLLWLGRAVDARGVGGRLPVPLIVLVLTRIREIAQRFARLAARIRAGKIYRRRPQAPRPGGGRPAGLRNTLPSSAAWLVRLVPEAAASASQLRFLLANPEMAALLAAAPAPMRRALRPLWRMLGVAPPPVLAPPDPPPVQPPAAPAAEREPSSPPAPRSPQPGPTVSTVPHACGPPIPLPA